MEKMMKLLQECRLLQGQDTNFVRLLDSQSIDEVPGPLCSVAEILDRSRMYLYVQ